MKGRNSILIGGIVLLLLAVFLMLQSRGLEDGENSDAQRKNASLSSAYGESSRHNRVRSPRKQTARDRVNLPATHAYADLKNFYLPALKLRDEPFTRAVYRLLSNYNDASRATGEQPMRFRCQHTKPAALKPLSLNLPNASFLSQLKLLCAAAGVQLEHQNEILTFTPIAETIDPDIDQSELYARRFNVSPAFLAKLNSLTKNDEQSTNPFADYGIPLAKTMVEQFLQTEKSAGGVTTNYLPTSSVLVARNTIVELTRLELLIATLAESPPTQLRTSIVQVTLPENVRIDPSEITSLRQLTYLNPIEVKTMPSVISRPDESFLVEIIREYRQNGKPSADWTGQKFKGQSSQLGFRVSHNYSFITGERDTEKETGQFSYQEAKKAGNTARGAPLVSTVDLPNGNQKVLFVISDVIDATGKKFPPPVRESERK